MTDILNKKVGEFNILDGFIITASKITTEQILARVPFVGNGTYRSGTIKVIGAILTSLISKNKFVQYSASGLLIDGAEDIISNIKGGINNNSATNGEVIL